MILKWFNFLVEKNKIMQIPLRNGIWIQIDFALTDEDDGDVEREKLDFFRCLA